MPLLQTHTASIASFIDFYSPSLDWLSVSTDRLRLPLLQTHTASFVSFIDFYSPSLDRLSVSTGGLRLPIFQACTASSLLLLIFIVLHLIGFQLVPADSYCRYFRPVLHHRFFYWFYSPSLERPSVSIGRIRLPLFQSHSAIEFQISNKNHLILYIRYLL